VIDSAEKASLFAKELQLLLRYLGVSHANMEKGEMRVEANISVSADDEFGLDHSSGVVGRTRGNEPRVLGTKVEVKNLNSFKSVERAIEYEVERQSKLLEVGESVVQETRGWDDVKQITFSQRIKETSDDYRYFPDPDLPKLQLDEVEDCNIEEIKKSLPELPEARRNRYLDLGLKEEDSLVYTNQRAFGDFFDGVVIYLKTKEEIQTASNYISSDLVGLFKDADAQDVISINHERFAELTRMIVSGELSSRGAKEVLKVMYESGGIPQDIAREYSLLQVRDESALNTIVHNVLVDNKEAVDAYKAGKEASLMFLVGQGMKESKGSADPKMLEKLIRDKLQNKEL